MGQDRQRLALAVFVLQPAEVFWSGRIRPEEQHRRFGEGPRERRMADLRAGGALPLPRRFLGTLDQAAVGRKILHTGEARDVMDFIQQHQAQNLTDPRDGA